MVVIRLARTGAKNSPFYHVVVADHRMPRDGRFIERVGYFDPMARGKATQLQLNAERIDHWINLGAQPSERVAHLIKIYRKRAQGPVEAIPTRSEIRKAQSEASIKSAKKAALEKAKTEEATAKEQETSAEQPAAEASPPTEDNK